MFDVGVVFFYFSPLGGFTEPDGCSRPVQPPRLCPASRVEFYPHAQLRPAVDRHFFAPPP